MEERIRNYMQGRLIITEKERSFKSNPEILNKIG